MNTCREFRDNLELALRGLPQPARLVPLSWDGHLLGCQACRDLLEAEQALEMLLASLPEPKLPAELASRVLERLKRERIKAPAKALDLDAPLDGAPDPVMPKDLAARILKGVAPAREASFQASQLDRLLDKLPEPNAPADLTANILAGLREERRPEPLQLLRGPRLWVPLAAAGLIAALWISRSWEGLEVDPAKEQDKEPHLADVIELNDEMAEAFEVLDNWEHLEGGDLDLLLASIDEVDELLIEASEWELDSSDESEEEAGG